MASTDDYVDDVTDNVDIESENDDDDGSTITNDDVDTDNDEDNEEKDKENSLNVDVDEEEDEEEEEDEDDDEDEEDDEGEKKNVSVINNPEQQPRLQDEYSDDSDDDDLDEDYLQKIDEEMHRDIISEHHHDMKTHNMNEIELLCKVVRNANGIIIDPLHSTLPFVTRYEMARAIGERAEQLEAGAKPFIEVKDNIIDSYLIAKLEYERKKIPYIIRRPLPNGGSEYWKLSDLQQIH